MPNAHYAIAKNEALKILSDYCIDNPGDVKFEHLAMDLGLLVKVGDLAGASGILTKRGQKGIITISKDIIIPGQKRFTIAHEIGHFRLHSREIPAFICTDEMFMAWYNRNQQEPEANAFAAELLMPEDVFRHFVDNKPPSKELFDEISGALQTSLTATCARYAEVGPYPCVLFVSTDGRLKWAKASHDMEHYFHIPIGSELTAYSCAGDFFYGGVEEIEPQKVRYDAWFTDYRLNHETELYEYPIYLKRYNTVLSLVWLN